MGKERPKNEEGKMERREEGVIGWLQRYSGRETIYNNNNKDNKESQKEGGTGTDRGRLGGWWSRQWCAYVYVYVYVEGGVAVGWW